MNTLQDYLEHLADYQNTLRLVNSSAPTLNLMQIVLGVVNHCCQHKEAARKSEKCSDYSDRPCRCRLSSFLV